MGLDDSSLQADLWPKSVELIFGLLDIWCCSAVTLLFHDVSTVNIFLIIFCPGTSFPGS